MPFAHLRTWVFDLDNTLYPADSRLFEQVARRMTAFIMDAYDLDEGAAKGLQRELFHRHGTTLRGLMSERGLDPLPFLRYVHDIEFDALIPDADLRAAIEALPGRRLIFTNGDADYAARVLGALGLEGVFSEVFDVVAAEFHPKPWPQAFARFAERHAIDPAETIMIEDMARNLEPAAALGWTTLWVRNAHPHAVAGADADYVHHVTDDLCAWLRAAVAGR